jgi:hypothetical protein
MHVIKQVFSHAAINLVLLILLHTFLFPNSTCLCQSCCYARAFVNVSSLRRASAVALEARFGTVTVRPFFPQFRCRTVPGGEESGRQTPFVCCSCPYLQDSQSEESQVCCCCYGGDLLRTIGQGQCGEFELLR